MIRRCHHDDDLRLAFRAHTEGQTHFTRRMVIAIALMFGMTPKQVVVQCEALGLCRRGSWAWFATHGGITRRQINAVRAQVSARSIH